MTTQIAMVKNPFVATNDNQHQTGGVIETKSHREATEVQAMVVMAKQFPRNQIQAMDRILNACTRQSLAETAVYSYPKGGQNIEGPSIRLAEVLAQNWGNVDFGIRELSQANGESTVEAFAWDLETNTRQVKVFQVPHKRFTKRGTTVLTDPRDIYELVANNGARRLRACILGVIPGDIVESAMNQCSLTLSATADTSPEGIKKVVDTFATFGIEQSHIEARYQCRLEAIRPAQIIEMRKIYSSIRDAMSKPSDWFDVEPEVKAKSSLNDLVSEEKPQAKLEPTTKPQPSQAQDGTLEPEPQDDESQMSLDDDFPL